MAISVFDVVDYILHKRGMTTTMKLQKLVYYCQAWSLVWDEKPLFKEEIEAWANGPVVRPLFRYFKGQYATCSTDKGDRTKLTDTQKETIDAVLAYYGDKPSQLLSDLTHMEKPWRKARRGIPDGEYCDEVILLADMDEYYSSILSLQ